MCASYNPSDVTLDERVYKIDYSSPGVVIIFNNKEFTDPIKYADRDGSEQDVFSLCTLFRGLNYEVVSPYINKTEAQMRKAIDDYATHDYTSYGCLILFIMSHGDKNKIISSDSEYIDLNEFITPLKRNASLKSKPKVFFIQACRGSARMTVNHDAPSITNSLSSNVYSRYFDHDKRLPREADFLFSYSTLEDHVSYRDVEDGSWYIQMLCKAIREEESKEISAILRYAHLLISKMVGGYLTNTDDKMVEVKMTPTYEDRLTKLFYVAEPPNVGNKSFFLIVSNFTSFVKLIKNN
jgi:caspase 6